MAPSVIEVQRLFRVIVIDDNEDTHKDYRDLLCSSHKKNAATGCAVSLFSENQDSLPVGIDAVPYEIDSAYQGVEGVEKIKQAVKEGRPYALAFIDLRMPPGWDGLRTAANALQIDSDLQIVICTACPDYSWNEIIHNLPDTSNLIVLKKPFDGIEVKQIARSLVEKWQLISSLNKRAEEQQANQEYLEITLNSIADAVIVTDQKGKVTRMNSVAETLTGWTRPNAVLTSLSTVFHLVKLSDHNTPLDPAREVLNDGEISVLPSNIILISKSGQKRRVAGNIAPIKDSLNNLAGAVLVFRDITRQQKIEADRLRLVSILESTSDIVATVLPDGTITYINKAGKEITGFNNTVSKKLLINTDFQPCWAARIIEEEAIPIALETGIWQGETAILGREGEEIPVSQVIMTHHPKDGETGYLSTVIRDISESKRAEAQIKELNKTLETKVINRTARLEAANYQLKRAKEAADQATLAKSSFLANMSHEIRTPMNGIIAAVDLAMSEALSPRLNHFLDIIHSSGYSLLGIINDVLDFSKIEAGKMELEHKPFQMEELVRNVVTPFINRVGDKKIELITDIEPRLPLRFRGDPLRIQQVLTNLISNSFKFTEENGAILFRIVKTNRQVEKNRIELKFSVQDNGIGLDSEQLKKIFQPFTQADTSTTRKYGGTGLGLSISQQLVEMMNGRMWAKSIPGRETTFSFTILMDIENRLEQDYVLPPSFLPLTALIADPSTTQLQILEKQLKSFGMSVLTATSWQKVLSWVQTRETQNDCCELFIIDANLPGPGISNIVKTLNTFRGKNVPVILMGAFGTDTTKETIDNSLIGGYLSKPFQASSLFDAVLSVLDDKTESISHLSSKERSEESSYLTDLMGLKVLIAEDNPTNQDIASAILQNVGIEVTPVWNGLEAVKAVHKESFDAVLMDMQMPEMDGYEATRSIRKEKQFADLPIIAITAHALMGDREKCLEAGMNGYLTKPINQKRLLKTLHTAVIQSSSAVGSPESIEAACLKPAAEIKNLENVPGLNPSAALKALDIDFETYQRILKNFLEHSGMLIERLKEIHGIGNPNHLAELAHSLKGSAANIGAQELQKCAESLERICKADGRFDDITDQISTSIQEMEARLEQVKSAARSIVDRSQPLQIGPPATVSQETDLTSAFQQLAEALRQSAPIAINRQLESLTGLIPEDRLKPITASIQNYEYTAALEELERLAKAINVAYS